MGCLPIVKVLKPGILIRSEAGQILDARSSITLIQEGEKNILVDTSAPEDRPLLLKALAQAQLKPEDIHIIILTHCHHDHAGNREIFPKARIYAHEACELNTNVIKIRIFPFALTDHIRLIATPGHSWDSITVLVKIKEVYAITGDAIPIKGNLEQWIPPIIHVDAELALTSMEQIIQAANYVIPGHGDLFNVASVERRDIGSS
ncbi:MAG: MBL fold metallo-hydrolase [Candidatus Helarchaeota archaeon]